MRREAILDAWSAGVPGPDVAAAHGMTTVRVRKLVYGARLSGDPRAAFRQQPCPDEGMRARYRTRRPADTCRGPACSLVGGGRPPGSDPRGLAGRARDAAHRGRGRRASALRRRRRRSRPSRQGHPRDVSGERDAVHDKARLAAAGQAALARDLARARVLHPGRRHNRRSPARPRRLWPGSGPPSRRALLLAELRTPTWRRWQEDDDEVEEESGQDVVPRGRGLHRGSRS